MGQPPLAEAVGKIVAAWGASSRTAGSCPRRQCFSHVRFSSTTRLPACMRRIQHFPFDTVLYTREEASSPQTSTHTVPLSADVNWSSSFFRNAATLMEKCPPTNHLCYAGSSTCRQVYSSRTQSPKLASRCDAVFLHIWECHRRLRLLSKKEACRLQQQKVWPANSCTSKHPRRLRALSCRPNNAVCAADPHTAVCFFGTRPRPSVGCRPARSDARSNTSAGPAAVSGVGVGGVTPSSFSLNVVGALQSRVGCVVPFSSACASALREPAPHRVAHLGLNSSLSAGCGGRPAADQPDTRSTPATRRVCIVGAGPAGFYCAKYLLQAAAGVTHDSPPEKSNALKVASLKDKAVPLRVDVLEKLPAPYGLVRYGVAPDHPEIKRVAEDFDAVAQSPSFRYFGNVALGRDVSLPELRSLYDAVIFAYGAAGERQLRLEGDDKFLGCLSARSFVGFYNAHPDIAPFVEKQLPHLSEESTGLEPSVAVVIGNGNVSLDVARLLTKHRKKLQSTDVHQPALAWIARANLRLVIILGRRGWVQASFTNKELRELVTDNDLLPVVHPYDFNTSLTEASKQELSESRLKQRSKVLLEQMVKNWERRNNVDCPVVQLRFLASPIRTVPHPDDPFRLGAVEIARNKLEGQPFHQQAVRAEGEEVERIPSSLLIWSTGFKCVHPQTVHFPTGKDGAFKNNLGRIVSSSVDKEGRRLAAVFASGWARRGPHGVIASNIMDAREVATNVLKDLEELSGGVGGPSVDLEKCKSMRVDKHAGGSSVRLEGIGQVQAVSTHTASGVASAETAFESLPDESLRYPAAAPATRSDDADRTTKAAKRLGESSFRENPVSRVYNSSPTQRDFAGNQDLTPAQTSESCLLSKSGRGQLKQIVGGEVRTHECSDIATLLRSRGVQFITFDDWLHIKSVERAKGQKEGKAAAKIATASEMLRIAKERLVARTGAHARQTS